MCPIDSTFALSVTEPLGTQLIGNLRARIVRGELAPGSRLSEQDTASAYGLSRQPVREAFIRLAGESLLEVRPQRGTFVRKIFTAAVAASRFVREAVEVEIARLAAWFGEAALVRDLDALLGWSRSIARSPRRSPCAIRRHLRGVLEDLPLIAAAQPELFETEPDAFGPDGQPYGRET